MRKRTGNRCASYIYSELFHHHFLAIDNIDAGARKVIYLATCQVIDARLLSCIEQLYLPDAGRIVIVHIIGQSHGTVYCAL